MIIQQPQAFDLVDSEILIAGTGSGFEGALTVKVTDGNNEITEFFNTGSSLPRQFQTSITIPDDVTFGQNLLFVTVFDEGAGGPPGEPPVPVPVLYGPRILPGYFAYMNYQVQAGDTLSGIADNFYEDSSQWPVIHAANSHTVSDPNQIVPGQTLRIPFTGPDSGE